MSGEISEMLAPGLTLIIGPPGVGKTRLCHDLAVNDLNAGKVVLFFSTEESIESLRAEFLPKLPQPNEQDRIRMYDAASNDLFSVPEDRGAGIITSDPENIVAVASVNIDRLKKQGTGRMSFYLDSLSRLFLNYKEDAVLKSFARFGRVLEQRGVAGVATMAPLLDAKRLAALETYSAGKIEVDFDDDPKRRRFRAEFLKHGSPGRDWRSYPIAAREAGESP